MSGSRAKARHTCYYIYIIYIIIYNYERPQRRTLPLPSNCQGMGQPARCIPALRTACSQQVSAYYSLASHPYFSVYAQFRVRAIDRASAIARSCDYHAHFFRIRLTDRHAPRRAFSLCSQTVSASAVSPSHKVDFQTQCCVQN